MPSYQLLQDVEERTSTWRPPRRLCLHDFATSERFRFARMLVALLLVILLAMLSLGSIMRQDDTQVADLGAPLRFTKDGTFQISIFEDLHFGESTTATNTPFVAAMS